MLLSMEGDAWGKIFLEQLVMLTMHFRLALYLFGSNFGLF